IKVTEGAQEVRFGQDARPHVLIHFRNQRYIFQHCVGTVDGSIDSTPSRRSAVDVTLIEDTIKVADRRLRSAAVQEIAVEFDEQVVVDTEEIGTKCCI